MCVICSYIPHVNAFSILQCRFVSQENFPVRDITFWQFDESTWTETPMYTNYLYKNDQKELNGCWNYLYDFWRVYGSKQFVYVNSFSSIYISGVCFSTIWIKFDYVFFFNLNKNFQKLFLFNVGIIAHHEYIKVCFKKL